jgi:(2Fe-2S) ferredoxin
MEKMAISMNEIQEATKDLFDKVSPDDIQRIVGLYGDEHAIEERVVDEYLKQKSPELKIVGEE